jgi:hypothetical protein
MTTVVTVVAVVALLAAWVTWTATRVDRLHSRVDAARATLDAQLVRRAAAAQAMVDRLPDQVDPHLAGALRAAAREALDADDAVRESAENDLGRALADLPTELLERPGPGLARELLHDLAEASSRVVLARRFYNDAVRDTRALRGRRLPRLLRLGAHRPLPRFFEIDEVTLPPGHRPRSVSRSGQPGERPPGHVAPGSPGARPRR